jgi:hypothetical protein
MTNTHDSKCRELAQHFLNDFGGDLDGDATADLAQTIQEAIEDWLGDRERAAEAAYERQQQSLMESGGPDDSHYRQSLKDAGRGHLLR